MRIHCISRSLFYNSNRMVLVEMSEDKGISDELQKLQSNIALLFQRVINEKNKCKNEKEKSIVSKEALVTELISLRRENEQLRKSNGDLKSSYETCMHQNVKLINQVEKYKILERNMNVLKEIACNVRNSAISPNRFSVLLMKLLNEYQNCGSKANDSSQVNLNKYKSAIEENSKTGNNSSNQFLSNEEGSIDLETGASSVNGEKKLNDEKSKEETRKKGDKTNKIESEDESYLEIISSFNESRSGFDLRNAEMSTPKKVEKSDVDFIDSPLYKEFLVRKRDASPILVDQRSLFNKPQFPNSPNQFKRKAIDSMSGSPGNAKSPRRRIFISPAKGLRPKSTPLIKDGNAIEAEIWTGGVRKFKQTKLNFESSKSKAQQSGTSVANAVRDDSNCKSANEDSKFGEDDVILESPKHHGNLFGESKKTFAKREEESEGDRTNGAAPVSVDPDETFVSSLYVRESVKEEPDTAKSESKIPTETRICSPEYNSVPYPYKGSPVRKKAERMKLPGQVCMECNQYYKAVLEEIDAGKLQRILNKCSRHRDKHYNIVETPPGYWKPYLTATLESTAQDDDDDDDDGGDSFDD